MRNTAHIYYASFTHNKRAIILHAVAPSPRMNTQIERERNPNKVPQTWGSDPIDSSRCSTNSHPLRVQKAPQTFVALNSLPTNFSRTLPAASHQILLQNSRSGIEMLVLLQSRRPAPRNKFHRQLRTTNVSILSCDNDMRYSYRRVTPPPSFASWGLCHLQHNASIPRKLVVFLFTLSSNGTK
ncbi:unnamed protein product [Ectocarpus sp. 6 AP-2014]